MSQSPIHMKNLIEICFYDSKQFLKHVHVSKTWASIILVLRIVAATCFITGIAFSEEIKPNADSTFISAEAGKKDNQTSESIAKKEKIAKHNAVIASGMYVYDEFINRWFGEEAIRIGKTEKLYFMGAGGWFYSYYAKDLTDEKNRWRKYSELISNAEYSANNPKPDDEKDGLFSATPNQLKNKNGSPAQKPIRTYKPSLCFDSDFDAFNECREN